MVAAKELLPAFAFAALRTREWKPMVRATPSVVSNMKATKYLQRIVKYLFLLLLLAAQVGIFSADTLRVECRTKHNLRPYDVPPQQPVKRLQGLQMQAMSTHARAFPLTTPKASRVALHCEYFNLPASGIHRICEIDVAECQLQTN